MATDAVKHLKHEILVGGGSNAFFNGVICWLLIGNGPSQTWTGAHSFAIDIIATALLLPPIVAAIVIPLQRRKMNKGKLTSIRLSGESKVQALADRFPASTAKSAGLYALIGVFLIAPVTLLGFYLLGIEQIEPLYYAIFKGVWAGVMASILIVPMVLTALRPSKSPSQ